MGRKTYELDPAHFLTAPGLAWPAALYQYVINGRKKYQRRNMICLLIINIQKLLTNTLKIMIKIKNHYTLKLVSAIFHYFSKTNVFLCYFKWSKSKRNLTYSCFFFPLFHEHLFSPGLPRATRLWRGQNSQIVRAHCTSPIMSFELYPHFLLDAELHLSVTFHKFITYILSW